ncbi:MAG TPA: hypothetical protein VNZ59_15655 [Burkholderiales bacterium]|nr:hypothetical protein [Burkholderiales bacterium]
MGNGHAAAGFSAGLALGAGDGDAASVVGSAGLAVRATGLAFFLFAAFVFFLAAFFLPVVLLATFFFFDDFFFFFFLPPFFAFFFAILNLLEGY